MHWQQYSVDERLELLHLTRDNSSIDLLAIEKDWWVTMTLKALSMASEAHLMSFKGGTSLSKGWNLIDRFSEDIDIALRREGQFAISSTSNTQLAKARRRARHYIVKVLPLELENALHSLGVTDFTIEPEIARQHDNVAVELRADTHPSVVYVSYRSILPTASDYMHPRVKIEISCLSMDEPVEQLTLRSLIATSVPQAEDVEVTFPTVVPTRTFLEKIFLLHEEFQKDKPRSKRMSRHLYDLERIMDTPFGTETLTNGDLYHAVVRHRSVFNNIPGIDYATHRPKTINFLPPEHLLDDWRKDYALLTSQFLYHGVPTLSFDALISRLRTLLKRLQELE